jgi:hypothetical protein
LPNKKSSTAFTSTIQIVGLINVRKIIVLAKTARISTIIASKRMQKTSARQALRLQTSKKSVISAIRLTVVYRST